MHLVHHAIGALPFETGKHLDLVHEINTNLNSSSKIQDRNESLLFPFFSISLIFFLIFLHDHVLLVSSLHSTSGVS